MIETIDMVEASRAKRLKALTHEVHDKLDKSVMEASSFDDLQGYGRFAQMQWAFHRDIDALYDNERLQAVLPGLQDRRRLALIGLDLVDLGLAPPVVESRPIFATKEVVSLPAALGWLYVAEGSNMGAALLRKQAAKLGLSDIHGARHLAPTAAGPAAHWRDFTAALDAPCFTDEEERSVVRGARSAFARVQDLAYACLG
ncbi:biliverdin-producing heme oxygenase [Parasphingorhabdus sp.]|uniref:biliverdin-producing heme oxygenase n=1 Tax=Parasphingorhabdus sp. TaxID=2709688 RepID=UPI003262DA93